MHENVSTIFLFNHSKGITVTKAAAAQIEKIVKANMICQYCGNRYSASSNPQVVINTCCLCFLRQPNYAHMRFIDRVPGTEEDNPEYRFLGYRGNVFVTRPGSLEVRENAYQTLTYYGFPVPLEFQREGRMLSLSEYSWSIYGDPRVDSVMFIDNRERDVVFLARKYGTYEEVNKRLKKFRVLLQQATDAIEASKNEDGYLIGSHRTWHYSEVDVYTVAASIENAVQNPTQTLLLHPE